MRFLPNKANSRIKMKRLCPFFGGFGNKPPAPPTPPVRVSAPGIAETLQVGQTVTVNPLPIYSGNPAPVVTWRWQMRPNGGGTITTLQTGGDLLLTPAQEGMQIRLQDSASNSQGSSGWSNNTWQGPVAAAPVSRVTVPVADGLGFSAHSFLYQAVALTPYGALGEYWTGDLAINYSGFSSLKERWDSDGVDRTADYNGALILTEIGDLQTGLADPASAQGIETLQYLYWFVLTAQAKGCKLVGIYIPHSPEGINIDADALAKVQYWLNWLRARPEITIPVYAIPVPVMVRAMVNQYAQDSIFIDGLHLRDASVAAPNQMNNALGQMVRMFLTGERPANDPNWNADLIGLVDTAWGILQGYEMTGFGGGTVIAPYPVATDPLPNPEPLPGGNPALKAETLTNPPFAITPSWPAPWSANHCPFTNWLKIARPYQTFGSVYMEWNDLLSNGHIDRNGVILSIPDGADNITMFTLENLTEDSGASGRFRLFYEGDGVVSVGGAAENVNYDTPGQIDFDYSPNGQRLVPVAVSAVNTQIEFTGLVHHDDLADYANSELKGFRPAWLDIVRNARIIRFKEWMAVDNEWGTSQWANRYLPERVTYQGEEGLPFEVMCDLCNMIGADPWFMLKSPTDDAYSESAAALVRSMLDPERYAYVEWSDKWWDGNNQGTFPWIQNLANQWFGETDLEHMSQAYAGRASEIFAIWRNEWSGADANRLCTVLQSWTGGVYFNQRLFDAPDYIAMRGAGTPTPYSLTTHFILDSKIDGGLSFPESDQLATIEGWVNTLTVEQVWDNMASACQAPFQGLSGYTLTGNSAFWEDHKTSLLNYPNVTVICGEGGWHLSVPYAHQGDDEWISIYTGFVRSSQGAAIFNGTMQRWYTSFPDPKNVYNRYSDVSRPDANQSQGIQRFVGDDGSDNLQWAAWLTQQAARQGATGRGELDFVGPYDYA